MEHPELLDDGAPVETSLALATWGLFVGLAFLLFGAGLFGTLLGVRSELAGLPTVVSSVISAAYYLGFLVGSKFALRALTKVGHIRAYVALASWLSIAMLGVGMTDSSAAWIGLRLVTGLCLAGQYVVAESWLNDLASNQNRGRVLAVYNVVIAAAFGVGQVFLFALDARMITGFAIASIVTSLAVAPVALSEYAVAPSMADTTKVSLRELAQIVPTGVGSCFLIGVAHGALTGMAAIYATRVGLSGAQTGLFLAAPSLGGVLLQWPISAASDDVDRRAVGVAAAVGAMGAGALLLIGDLPPTWSVLLVGALGAFSYPLYSISVAYTNDWIEPDQVNSAASQLVTLYGIGAVVGPFAAAAAMDGIGDSGFYWSLIATHGALAVFFVYRMWVWRSPITKKPWSETSIPAKAFFLPGTIVQIGRRRRRSATDH